MLQSNNWEKREKIRNVPTTRIYVFSIKGKKQHIFCRISLVMYLVYYNYSNAGPECQADTWHCSVCRGLNEFAIAVDQIFLRTAHRLT